METFCNCANLQRSDVKIHDEDDNPQESIFLKNIPFARTASCWPDTELAAFLKQRCPPSAE